MAPCRLYDGVCLMSRVIERMFPGVNAYWSSMSPDGLKLRSREITLRGQEEVKTSTRSGDNTKDCGKVVDGWSFDSR